MKKHYPEDAGDLNQPEYMPPFSALDVNVISYITGKIVSTHTASQLISAQLIRLHTYLLSVCEIRHKH